MTKDDPEKWIDKYPNKELQRRFPQADGSWENGNKCVGSQFCVNARVGSKLSYPPNVKSIVNNGGSNIINRVNSVKSGGLMTMYYNKATYGHMIRVGNTGNWYHASSTLGGFVKTTGVNRLFYNIFYKTSQSNGNSYLQNYWILK